MLKDYYKILKVERTATQEDIKTSFRDLARTYHPDVSEEESAHDFFVEINEAYQILSDTNKRKRYDILLGSSIDKRRFKSYGAYQRDRIIRRHFNLWVEKARKRAKEYAKKQYKEYAKSIDCYFYPSSKADGDPYYFYLHKEIGVTVGKSVVGIHAMQKSIKYKNITIPIPRSRKAQKLHNIGFGIKLFTLLLVIILAMAGLLSETSILLAWIMAALILFVGGVACHLLYYIFGVRSVFYYAERFPRVQEYIKKDFHTGAYTLVTTSPFGMVLYALRWLL